MTNDAVGATNSTRPGHDLSVVYENRAVPGAEIDLQQWTWANRTTGRIVSYVATGPCPACHGRCEGWGDDASNPIEKKFRGPDTPDPTPSHLSGLRGRLRRAGFARRTLPEPDRRTRRPPQPCPPHRGIERASHDSQCRDRHVHRDRAHRSRSRRDLVPALGPENRACLCERPRCRRGRDRGEPCRCDPDRTRDGDRSLPVTSTTPDGGR